MTAEDRRNSHIRPGWLRRTLKKYMQPSNLIYAWLGGPNPYRLMTTGQRALPSFLIIGAQRSGTTSLYRYLAEHPNVKPAIKKEIQFFDFKYGKGINWYRAHFPMAGSDNLFITGEARPNYLFHADAPARAASILPEVMLLAILRNPVERAYSNFWHEVRLGHERRSFEEAVRREKDKLVAHSGSHDDDNGDYNFDLHHHSYLGRGLYAQQIERWLKFFRKEQLLVIQSESFYADPPLILAKINKFLNLPEHEWESHPRKLYNRASYPEMGDKTQQTLLEFFRPHNERLFEILGREFNWTGID